MTNQTNQLKRPRDATNIVCSPCLWDRPLIFLRHNPATTAYIPQEFPSAKGIAASNVFSRRRPVPALPARATVSDRKYPATDGRPRRKGGEGGPGVRCPVRPCRRSPAPNQLQAFRCEFDGRNGLLGWGKEAPPLRGGGEDQSLQWSIDGAGCTRGRLGHTETYASSDRWSVRRGPGQAGASCQTRECKLHRHHWRLARYRAAVCRLDLLSPLVDVDACLVLPRLLWFYNTK